jgi:hypothetical protein
MAFIPDILSAGQLWGLGDALESAEGSDGRPGCAVGASSAPLFHPAFERAVSSLGDVFDLVIASVNPTAYDGKILKTESLSTRVWFKGRGVFTDNTEPEYSRIELLLRALSSGLFLPLHKKNRSLFLHPFFFSHLSGHTISAPPILIGHTHDVSKTSDLSSARHFDLATGSLIDGKFGFLHASSIESYEQSSIHNYWGKVRKLIKRANISEKDHAGRCLEIATNGTHGIVNSWLAMLHLASGEAISTTLYVMPVSTIFAPHSRKEDVLPHGLAGMVWLTLISRGSAKDAKASGLELARLLWALCLGSSIDRKISLQRDFGEMQAKSYSSHEVKHVSAAMARWVTAGTNLFDFDDERPQKPEKMSAKIGKIVLYDRYKELSPKEIGTVAFPTLFRQGTSFISTWALTEYPSDLPFWTGLRRDLPQTLGLLASRCWESAYDACVFSRVWGDHWTSERVLALKRALPLLRTLFPGEPVSFTDGKDIPLSWDPLEDDGRRARAATRLSRLLLHITREAIQHGEWGAPIHFSLRTVLPLTTGWTLLCENAIGNPDDKCRQLKQLLSRDEILSLDPNIATLGDGLYSPAGREIVHPDHETDGDDVLTFLVEHFSEGAVKSKPNINDGIFRRVITFIDMPILKRNDNE